MTDDAEAQRPGDLARPGTAAEQTNQLIGNRYRLLRPLARGGMAEVWQAHDETLDRDVAIKLLHTHLASDPDFVERFRREARAVARLAHPNVVAVYDTGVESASTTAADRGKQRAFIVMELLRGDSLRTLLNKTGAARPTPTESVQIIAEAADGLAYAHRNGVVHRDVKPGNIFIESANKEAGGGRFGRVRVVDFGIAKQAAGTDHSSEDLTNIGSILGTAKYVSPEQVEGGNVDARSDIYSLGVVLYEMVCGRVPFLGPNDLATAMLHVRSAPEAPRSVRAGIPRALESLILRTLQKSPSDRFTTAADLATALRGLDMRPDDAAPAVTRTAHDVTPPRGTTRTTAGSGARDGSGTAAGAVPTTNATTKPTVESRPRTRRRSLVLLLPLVGLLGGALVGITLADKQKHKLMPLMALRAASFELDGDGEHDSALPLLLDGNPATSWSTETYGSRSFNGRKSGVGVYLILPDAAEVRRLTIDTTSLGWAAKVYVSDRLATDLDGWGDSVGEVVNSTVGQTSVNLRASRGRYVLLWITDLGPKVGQFAQVKIGELRASG